MKTNILTRRVIELALCAGILVPFTGCVAWTSVNGISPVYPKRGFLTAPRVDSLQPELKWKGGDESKRYDLAIWNTILVDNGNGVQEPQAPKMIYQKTGLSGTAHKVEIILEPQTWYFWSVRETGKVIWSTESVNVAALGNTASDSSYFGFKTPTAAELEKTTGRISP